MHVRIVAGELVQLVERARRAVVYAASVRKTRVRSRRDYFMVSDLTAQMIQVMLRAIMKHVDEMPANDATSVLLHQYKQSLQWLQARAQEIDSRPETTRVFSKSISVVSQMIDKIERQKKVKFATRTHDQVEPFDLVKLLAAWDRDFPGGSVAVLVQLEEILSRPENKIDISDIAAKLTR